MVWTALTFSFGSLLTATKMTQLKDNITAQANGDSGAPENQTDSYADLSVTAAKLASNSVELAKMDNDSVDSAEILADAIKQSEIDDNSAVNSITNPNTDTATSNFNATGGKFVMGWQMYTDDTGDVDEATVYIGDERGSTVTSLTGAYTSAYTLRVSASDTTTGSTYARHSYIGASPPYKIGPIDYPYFFFVHLNKDAEVEACAGAYDPPWAYNGPYKATAMTYRKKKDKDGVRSLIATPYIKTREIPDEIKRLKITNYETYLRECRRISLVEKPLTMEMKNINKQYVPHPFKLKAGEKAIMIAPDDKIMECFSELHNEDNEDNVHGLLLSDIVRLGDEISLAEAPPNLSIVKARFK